MSDFNNQNRIRKTWVSMVDTQRFKKIPKEERFRQYNELDKRIGERWVSSMKNHHETQVMLGNFTNINGHIKLNKDSCCDADNVLLESAKYILMKEGLL